MSAPSVWQAIDAAAEVPEEDDLADGYNLGRRDGFSEAVQLIDQMTGGDGEYRYCTVPSDRHCPDPDAMILRISERFAVRCEQP